jgi:hypothetical protein
MRQLPFAVVLVALSVSFGCSSEEWIHRYKKPDELVYDYNSCERQIEALQSSGARTVQITSYVRKTT